VATNRKIQSESNITNTRASTDARLHDTFVAVLRRRADPEADVDTLRAERLAKWDALGRELEANGWHNLETALEAARDSVCKHRPREVHEEQPIGVEEAEQLAARFAEDCRRIIDAGGAMTLWHVIVADRHIPHPVLDDFVEGRREGDPVTAPQADMLVDSARCYALAAIAGETAPSCWTELRMLFGSNTDAADLDWFAPFAIDNDTDENASRQRGAASAFATATTNAHRIEATCEYAYGFEMASESFTLRAVQRLGLLAWLARRAIRGTLRSVPKASRAAVEQAVH